MAFYERWREQHDADEWFEELGFKEKLIHGIRLYYNENTGESLELFRPKQVYLKSVQKGIFLSEGILERLVDKLKDVDLSDDQKKKLWEFIKDEKETLNQLKQNINVKGNK